MSKGNPAKKQHRSMRGKNVDMDLLRKRNELTPAVGNARVNARGDELGAGGKIVRPKEEVLKDYYKSSTGVVSEAATKKGEPNAPTAAELAEWEEDDDGNFVQKQ